MPAIAHEPFRRWFYQHWGRENCIVWARARQVEMPALEQRLSIKAAWGGREEYFIDGRRVAVDDHTFMVLNDGRSYGSRLDSPTPVTSFAIFFRPGMAGDVARCHELTDPALLDDPAGTRARGFGEQLRTHDARISPVLRFIRHHVERGLDDEGWYEEQLYFLLGRMQSLHGDDCAGTARVPAARAGTRQEIFRRLGRCVDFIHTHYRQPLGLTEIAHAAHLSPYHCLRLFRSVHGCTPVAYLRQRRLQEGLRMLRQGELAVDEIAARAGLGNRTTLFRQLRAVHGASARARCAPAVPGTEDPAPPTAAMGPVRGSRWPPRRRARSGSRSPRSTRS
jgi:AraC family transcriptional regulator